MRACELSISLSLSLSSFYPPSFETRREKEERLSGVKSGARSQYRDVLFSIDAQPREEYRSPSARSPTLINSGLAINSKSQSASIQPSRNRIRGP